MRLHPMQLRSSGCRLDVAAIEVKLRNRELPAADSAHDTIQPRRCADLIMSVES